MVHSKISYLKNSPNGTLDTLLISFNMNRFKRHPDAEPAATSEFYSDAIWAGIAITVPAMQKSDRFRQELLFSCIFLNRQPKLNLEQSEILFAISEKWRKFVDDEPLDGTEPFITFEEFSEWGIRYPID